MDRFIKYSDKHNKNSPKSPKNKIGKQKTLSNGAVGQWKMEGGNLVFRIVKGVKNNPAYMRSLRDRRKSAEERRNINNQIKNNNKNIDKTMLGGNQNNKIKRNVTISQATALAKGRAALALKRQVGGRVVTQADGAIGQKPTCPVGEPVLVSESGNAPQYKCQ